jgi:hypothetical protein
MNEKGSRTSRAVHITSEKVTSPAYSSSIFCKFDDFFMVLQALTTKLAFVRESSTFEAK